MWGEEEREARKTHLGGESALLVARVWWGRAGGSLERAPRHRFVSGQLANDEIQK